MGFMHGAPILLGDNTVPGVQLSPELKQYIPKILQACRDWGLDFYPTVVQLLTYDEISEIAAYGGFPVRFPHWSFGMEYEELQRGYEYGMHKIYEMVINCWVRDTQVISKRGSIPVQEVRVGDELFSGSGSRKVVAVVEQPLGDVVRIKLRRNLQEIICTPNHKLMAYSNGVPQWVEAGKLKSGDVLLAGGDFKDFIGVAPEIKWDKSKVFESTAKNVRNRLIDISTPNNLTLELAEILGLCVGDGSTGTPGTENVVAVSVGKDSKYDDYRFRIESLFNKVFGRKPSVYEKANCWSIQMNNKYVVDFLDEVGLFKGVTFESKRVPPIIWASSNEYRAAFLKGVFDTDGSASGRSLTMSSMSKNLIKDIQLLLMEMGIASQADKIDNKHNNIWTLCINGPWNKSKFQSLIGFSIPYKQRELESQVLLKTPGKTGLMIEGLQKEISNVIDSLPNQNKLPTWVRRFRNRNNSIMGTDPIWGFVQKMCEAGYAGFDLFLNLLEKPMYVVEEVSSAGQEKTWDIALDHDDHDFLANGLISHNTNPCYIYNLSSNTLLDHLTVVAHATGHNDFFKNNIHFAATDTNMLNKMANHGTRIRKYMARWGKERVTEFLDWVMRLETLIDGAEAWTERVIKEKNIRDERKYHYPRRLTVDKNRMYMEPFLNTKQFIQRENEKIVEQDIAEEIGVFKEPTKNILAFLRDNAPLKPWQADIVSMLYEEAIYFYPQRQTKTLNEGWACARRDTLIPTNIGILPLGEIVDNKLPVTVFDGKENKKVTNWFSFENRDVYRVQTRRGYVIEGSCNHRLFDNQDDWVRLDEMQIGKHLKLSTSNVWNDELQKIDFVAAEKRVELKEIAEELDLTFSQVAYRKYNYKGEEKQDSLGLMLKEYDAQTVSSMRNKRKLINVPEFMDEDLASFIGYMIGDGHISQVKRTMGLTTGDKPQADNFVMLVNKLFGLDCSCRWDDSSKNGRHRVSFSSKDLETFLVSLGMKTGVCARIKQIPDMILKSPKKVVAAFIRSYFDCDGYAGSSGVILSTSSEILSRQIQNVLLNFEILSTRKINKDGCWHVRITGSEAVKYQKEIGFGLERKQVKLEKYISSHSWFVKQKLEDKIISVEKIGVDTVYDITVEDSHRYSAAGFINHNSTTDSVIMAEQGFVSLGQKSHDCGIVEYADHKMGVLGGKYSMNPYKLGYYLLKDIRERWDKGRFGPEWDECTDIRIKENWDKKTNLGKEKIFEVRKYYDDFTFLHEFFTEDFCREQEYFHWKHYPNGEFRIETKDYKEIKRLLMRRHLNGGLPDIRLTEPNYRGKGAVFLQHYHDGRNIYAPYIFDVLTALRAIWGEDVFLATKNGNDEEQVYCCYGTDSTKDVEILSRQDHLT